MTKEIAIQKILKNCNIKNLQLVSSSQFGVGLESLSEFYWNCTDIKRTDHKIVQNFICGKKFHSYEECLITYNTQIVCLWWITNCNQYNQIYLWLVLRDSTISGSTYSIYIFSFLICTSFVNKLNTSFSPILDLMLIKN